MKVLLDKCLPLDLRHHFGGHETHTVQWAGLKGAKNGELLRRAEALGYEVLLTVDQGIYYQQNQHGRSITIVVFRSKTNPLEDLISLVPDVLEALMVISPGAVAYVPH